MRHACTTSSACRVCKLESLHYKSDVVHAPGIGTVAQQGWQLIFCTAQRATGGSPFVQYAKIADCTADYKWKARKRPKNMNWVMVRAIDAGTRHAHHIGHRRAPDE